MKKLKWVLTLILTLAVVFLLVSARESAKRESILSKQMFDLKGNFERVTKDRQLIDSLSGELDELRGVQASDRQEVDELRDGFSDWNKLWDNLFDREQDEYMNGAGK